MAWAFESASLLVSAVESEGDRVWSPAAAAEYLQQWHRHIGRRLRRCAMLMRVLRSPILSSSAAAVVRAMPSLGRMAINDFVTPRLGCEA
jgi:hypothetical protein